MILFELLVLSGALAEVTSPEILKMRQTFREIFMDFDPADACIINEKNSWHLKALSLIFCQNKSSELSSKILARYFKIVDEFRSFHRCGLLNNKPIANQFRHPKQVTVKSPKVNIINKHMLRRGFRGVGPTVIYSFMQIAGLTNDHLVSCFRFKECNADPSPCASDPEGRRGGRSEKE